MEGPDSVPGDFQEVDMLQAMAWHSMRPKSHSSHSTSHGTQASFNSAKQYHLAATPPAADTASSDKQAASTGTGSSSPAEGQEEEGVPTDPSELPQIAKLLHNNPSCTVTKQHKGSRQQGKSSRIGPDAAVSATAAVGGLVALTGSLLSYALARARSGRRERHLKEGLSRKEAALASMQAELEALKSTATRMLQLEAELAASNTHLLAMNQEVELARAASKRIEGDMAQFQDQLLSLSTTKSEIKAAMALAEAKAQEAEQRRQEAEAHRKQAEARWQASKQQLEQAQTEVDNLRGELGLRGSQLEGLTRELEFTRRQLANAQKRVEHAQMAERQQRVGYSSYSVDDTEAWD